MDKKDLNSDFLTIKEFANLVGITVSSLQHYDRKGIFCPAKRGKKFKNNYRYYSPLQITIVKMIRVLREIGVPLDAIKNLMNDRSPEIMVKLLTKNRDMVANEILFLKDVHYVINTFTGLLNEGMAATETEINVIEMPGKKIILGEKNDFHGESGFMREFLRFCKGSFKPKLNLSYPVGGYWENMEKFLGEPSRPMRFFSTDPKGHEQKAAGLYLVGYTRGYYGQTNDLPDRMTAFAKKSGLVFTGAVYNLYLFDEISIADPNQYLLQASASVMETRRISSRRPQRFYEYE